MDWTQPGNLVRIIFPSALWRKRDNQKVLYLTFDDGPMPGITEWVLKQLQNFEIKATFFCIGKNIENHPKLFDLIKSAGHQIGNHTFHHDKGWKISNKVYYESIKNCQQYIPSKLLRPPYGKMKLSQYFHLKKRYKIVMWDVLTYDYDNKISAEISLQKSLKKTRPGSIIVFHDSLKAKEKLQIILPQYLTICIKEGYQFKTL